MNSGEKSGKTALDSHFYIIFSVLSFRLYLLTNVNYTVLQVLIQSLNGICISPKTWNTSQVLIYGHTSNPNTLNCTNHCPQEHLLLHTAIVCISFNEIHSTSPFSWTSSFRQLEAICRVHKTVMITKQNKKNLVLFHCPSHSHQVTGTSFAHDVLWSAHCSQTLSTI